MNKKAKTILACIYISVTIAILFFFFTMIISKKIKIDENINTENNSIEKFNNLSDLIEILEIDPYAGIKKNINKILVIMLNELGNGEDQKSETKYGTFFNTPQCRWSTEFIAWCVYEADVTLTNNNPEHIALLNNLYPKKASSTECVSWYQERNLFKRPFGYLPNVGDMIFFDDNADNETDHAGIVFAVYSENNEIIIKVIEGDIDKKVVFIEYNASSSPIFGYGQVYNDPISELKREFNNLNRNLYTRESLDIVDKAMEDSKHIYDMSVYPILIKAKAALTVKRSEDFKKFISKTLEIANNEIGVAVDNNGETKYAAFMGNPKEAWCTEFVMWCLNEAQSEFETNYSKSVYPFLTSAYDVNDWAEKRNLLRKAYKIPEIGNIILFNTDPNYFVPDHTGIIAGMEYDETDEQLYIITYEGNITYENPHVEVKRQRHLFESSLIYSIIDLND